MSDARDGLPLIDGKCVHQRARPNKQNVRQLAAPDSFQKIRRKNHRTAPASLSAGMGVRCFRIKNHGSAVGVIGGKIVPL